MIWFVLRGKNKFYFDSEKYVEIDSLEGKKIKSDYNITKIPTIILSEEILDYDGINVLLDKTGTIEKDKVFIFREINQLQVKYQEIN